MIVNVTSNCEKCGGTGQWVTGASEEGVPATQTCPDCEGTGKVVLGEWDGTPLKNKLNTIEDKLDTIIAALP